MLKTKIKVGHYYELKLKEDLKLPFAVLYGFERGKNKGVYTVMIYLHDRAFEFPIKESLFNKWVSEGRIREIDGDHIIDYLLKRK